MPKHAAERPRGKSSRGPEPEQALAWFNREHKVLLAAVREMSAWGLDNHVWRLSGKWALRAIASQLHDPHP